MNSQRQNRATRRKRMNFGKIQGRGSKAYTTVKYKIRKGKKVRVF